MRTRRWSRTGISSPRAPRRICRSSTRPSATPSSGPEPPHGEFGPLMDLGIRDRVALVGGASRGIGQAAARALAGEGVKVALVARNSDAVQTAAAELAREAGVSTLGIAADLATAEGCQRSVDETVARFGKLDILVANAGGPPPGAIDALDDSTWQRAFELTFLSTVRLCSAAVAAMLPGGWGRIAIVGSSSMV